MPFARFFSILTDFLPLPARPKLPPCKANPENIPAVKSQVKATEAFRPKDRRLDFNNSDAGSTAKVPMPVPAPLPPLNPAQAEAWMTEALAEARLAMEANEVPVGCVVVDAAGRVVGRGGDARQAAGDPMAHAEVLAIREAAETQGDWRLDGHTLVVTLEPCPMCAGLILMSRIGRVIYGAASDKWGAAGSRLDLLGSGAFPHKPEVVAGVKAEPCAAVLSEYFARLRGSPTGAPPPEAAG